MSTGVFCGVAPFLLRKMSVGKLRGEKLKSSLKNMRNKKSPKVQTPSGVETNFVTMTDLRNKLSHFRDLLDFSPCLGSVPVNEMLVLTLNDLFKHYPKIKPMSVYKRPSLHKALKIFCDALKSLGDLWTTENWMVNCKYNSSKKLGHVELEKTALAMLDDIIKLARERIYDEMDDYDSPRSSAFGKALSESSDNRTSFSSSPETPTSVLPSSCWKSASPARDKICYSPPLLLPLRVQAVGKLNPIDVKRLSFHMFPHAVAIAHDPKYAVLLNNSEMEEQLSEMRPSDVNEGRLDDKMMTEDNRDSEMECDSPRISATCSAGGIGNSGRKSTDIQPQPPLEASEKQEMDVCLSPPPPPPLPAAMTRTNLATVPLPPPPPPRPQPPSLPVTPQNTASPPPPPPPPPRMALANRAPPPPPPPMPTSALMPTAPPPPPPPMSISKSTQAAPSSPPPPSKGKGAAPLPPPPPMSKGFGAVPPPPPGVLCLRAKKANTKLKRSSHIGNLYRVLKGKVEGSSLEGKSSGRKGNVGGGGGGAAGGKGMADALAEMTKRSAYFQQIEEDVKNYAATIKEVKVAISSFQTSDMTELLKFHKYVESHLEKLTDETQVLARFEDFPGKKLEALRMAAALYSKLDSIVATLQNWPIVAPVGKLLDKAENYFNKIKVDIDALERTKDDEAKRFQAQKITFDFGILVRIKELMVDVSSNCMELAIKEKREACMDQEEKPEKKKDGSAKVLWRAFQFAFRVYTFAGGHDERADSLTRELAKEIECDN